MAGTRLTAQDWRHLLTVGALVAGVLGTLVLGGRLRAEPANEAPRELATVAPVATTPTPPGPRDGRVVAEPAVVPPPAEPRTPPAERGDRPVTSRPAAARAVERDDVPAADGPWTLQFIMTCQTETADRLARDLGHDSRLRLFPIRHAGRDCLRVCWGDFATRDAALRRDGVPEALLAVNRDPIPRRTADLR